MADNDLTKPVTMFCIELEAADLRAVETLTRELGRSPEAVIRDAIREKVSRWRVEIFEPPSTGKPDPF